MILLALGAFLIVLGALSLSFPVFCEKLKRYDEANWRLLGSPNGYSFADMGLSSGTFSWILAQGYKKSPSEEVVAEGNKAFKKALFAKYALVSGCAFLCVGFGLALASAA